MAFFFSKRKLRPRDEEGAGELNIVPYLDILMNLIVFVLLSLTGLTAFGVVNASAQSSGPSPGPGAEAPLMVAISAQGFAVGATALAKAEDGSYDYAALTERMIALKAAFPAETKLTLAADSDVPYEVLVATMDAVREAPGRRPLFPDITLGRF